jgi:hypothetical protein
LKENFSLITLFFIFAGAIGLNAQGLSGTFYIPQGGNPQGFNSLSEACTAISTSGANGVVIFIIDENLTETAPLLINNSTLTGSNHLIIKPAPGKQPIVSFTGINSDGEFFTINNSSYVNILGSSSNAYFGTRDLTFEFDNPDGKRAIQVYGNSRFLTIKNMKIIPINISRTFQTTGVALNGSVGSIGPVPTNAYIYDCQVGTENIGFDDCFGFWGYDSTSQVSATVRLCDLYARHRGITTSHIKDNYFDGNRISIIDPIPDQECYTGIEISGSGTGDYTKIYNNRFDKFDVNTSSGKLACAIVVYGNSGTLYIMNNFFSATFTNSGVATDNRYYGVLFNSTEWRGIAWFAHNSFRINTPNTTGINAAIGYNLIPGSSNTLNTVNNLFLQEGNTANSYIIHYPMQPNNSNIINFDWNTYFLSNTGSNFGFINNSVIATFNDWKLATQQEYSSNYKNINFVSPNDLHLTGYSVGDFDLRGTPFPNVAVDIDGQERNHSFPYKGADEADVRLPVELTSFRAIQNGRTVVLDWETATEGNNMGFEIHRSVDSVSFQAIGFIRGNGTTTRPHSYQFIDADAPEGMVYYKLRQIDMNGVSDFTTVVLLNFVATRDFVVFPNYPNPFNPSTSIKFSLPSFARVEIRVFDVTGRIVLDILPTDMQPGLHSLKFDASNLASGSYFYTVTAITSDGTIFKDTRKMQYIK